MTQSQVWVSWFSLPWEQAPASSQEGQRLERWGSCFKQLIQDSQLAQDSRNVFLGGLGEFCEGPVSGRVKACCGMRNPSDEKPTSLLPASPTSIHLGRWVLWFPCHYGNPLPTPHAHSRGWPRRGLCWTKATEFKNLERVPHNRRTYRMPKPFWF